jgi:hypothetical protein
VVAAVEHRLPPRRVEEREHGGGDARLLAEHTVEASEDIVQRPEDA